jgi:hypothetical protein
MNDITKERLHELFEYRDGKLYWKRSPTRSVPKGSRAGTLDDRPKFGYRHIKVDGKRRSEHRLIYTMFHGDCPDTIDHINGIKDDNRIENLRPCNRQQNQWNMKSWNSSGVKSVTWFEPRKKWVVRISPVGNLGYFSTLKEAERMAKFARRVLHGEFAKD